MKESNFRDFCKSFQSEEAEDLYVEVEVEDFKFIEHVKKLYNT